MQVNQVHVPKSPNPIHSQIARNVANKSKIMTQIVIKEALKAWGSDTCLT